MSNSKWVPNSPQEEMAYWRPVRQYGTFILAVALVVTFTLGDFALGVVLATAFSIVSGTGAFRLLIERNPRIRAVARLGKRRTGVLVILAVLFLSIVVAQAILATEFGASLAGAVAPLAFVVEWLIARELCGTGTAEKIGEGRNP